MFAFISFLHYCVFSAAQEGLCSAYVITALPKIDSSASLTRNHSFSLKRGTNAVKEASRMATGLLATMVITQRQRCWLMAILK